MDPDQAVGRSLSDGPGSQMISPGWLRVAKGYCFRVRFCWPHRRGAIFEAATAYFSFPEVGVEPTLTISLLSLPGLPLWLLFPGEASARTTDSETCPKRQPELGGRGFRSPFRNDIIIVHSAFYIKLRCGRGKALQVKQQRPAPLSPPIGDLLILYGAFDSYTVTFLQLNDQLPVF